MVFLTETGTLSRLFAIGDIHGCFSALQTLLQDVPLTPQDQVVTLGDYVDRGPESRQVVEWLISEAKTDQFIPLRGNHEIMMLDALRGRMPMHHWLQFGGRDALQSYARPGTYGTPEDIPVEHLRFLDRELRPYYETESHLFVHAGMHPLLSPPDQNDEWLFWERFDSLSAHASGKTIICGHTAQKSGLPQNRGYAICIDTWAYGQGWLTCLDVGSGQYWQANQRGESRSDWLPEPAA